MEQSQVKHEQPPSQISFGIRKFIIGLAAIVVTAVVILMVIRYMIL